MHLYTSTMAHRTVDGESETARRMGEASSTLLASLSPEQQDRILFPVTDEERMNWHYIPRARQGLSLKEMDGSQRKFACLSGEPITPTSPHQIHLTRAGDL